MVIAVEDAPAREVTYRVTGAVVDGRRVCAPANASSSLAELPEKGNRVKIKS